jgi:hypothetical protein
VRLLRRDSSTRRVRTQPLHRVGRLVGVTLFFPWVGAQVIAVDPLCEWIADRTEPPVMTWPLIGLYVPEPPPVAKTFDLGESAVRRPSVMNDRIPDLVYLHVQMPAVGVRRHHLWQPPIVSCGTPISFDIFVAPDMSISLAIAVLVLLWNAVLYAFTTSDSVLMCLHSGRQYPTLSLSSG